MKDLTLNNRVRGALLGLACGDALGAPAEFHDQAFIKRTWGTLTEMVGGGVWEPGEITDDTGMALCIAEAILENPDNPIDGAGERFLEWRKTTKDCGSTIAAALSNYGRTKDWPTASQSTPQAKSGKAAGNGGLMRTLPVALAYPDKTEMLAKAAQLSAMTHWDSEAEACSVIYCLMVARLLEGEAIAEAWDGARREAKAHPLSPTSQIPGTLHLKPQFWQRLNAVESLTYEQLQPTGYAGYCVETLEAAVWCCLHSASLEEAIVQAVNLAGEADTIGAVAGGIAGAFWGEEAIPARWLNRLQKRAELAHVAQQLAELRSQQEAQGTAPSDEAQEHSAEFGMMTFIKDGEALTMDQLKAKAAEEERLQAKGEATMRAAYEERLAQLKARGDL